jgi:4-(gamma-glutamylamino)butanal dehydrogenase
MQMTEQINWMFAAERLKVAARSFIDGEHVEALNGEVIEHVNPMNGEIQYALSVADETLLNRAVAISRRRFNDGVWSRCSPAVRRDALVKLAALIDENRERLAICETLDTGKAISDSYNYDVPGSAATLRWYAGAIDKLYGETAPVECGVLATINLQPIGVVGAVIPWNFPIETAFWKAAPALAIGNSVVLKPDEKSSRSAIAVAELAIQAGIPAGVFNVVTGGPNLGQLMGLHPDIDALAFTGSTEVGKKFLEYSSRSNLKLVSLECGGKSANVVFADTADLKRAAKAAARGIFFNQGQVCSANSRLIVEASITEEFANLVSEESAFYSPAFPLDPSTSVGSMIGRDHRDRVLKLIERSVEQGGRIVCGGIAKVVRGYDNYIEPTIIANLAPDAELAREEAFGPVLCVLPFETECEAIKIANDSRYALSASLWSGSFERAHRVAERLLGGTISVNAVDALHVSIPFGGFRQSGFGRDLSLHALRNYAQPKAIWYDYRS